MAPIDKVGIELTVVIGECEVPLRRLLRMGRGAFIPLGGRAGQRLEIRANQRLIAHGRVVLDGDKVNIRIAGREADAA